MDTTARKENNMDTVTVPAGEFPGTVVARHNGYSLRREELPNGTVNWRITRPISGHRIDYRRGSADVFSVDPYQSDIYGNAASARYARSLLDAVEAASVFAGIVNQIVAGN